MHIKKSTVLIISFAYFVLAVPVHADDPVTAPSLNSSYGVVDVSSRAFLPPELYTTPTPQPGSPPITPPPVKVGVAENAFNNFKCTLGGWIPWLGKNLCPKDLDLAGHTADFSNKSGVLIKSERPNEIQPLPAKKDDRIQNTGTLTGNNEINKIQTSLGTDPGWYTDSTPRFDELQITDPNNLPEAYKQAASSSNLKLGDNSFNEDLRVPDTTIREDLFYKSTLPEGVRPFSQPSGTGQ